MSLRSRMIGGVTGVMVLIWAVVTANLLVDGYARHRAHLQEYSRILGSSIGSAIGVSTDTGEINRKLSETGIVNGWILVSRDASGLVVRASRPEDREFTKEDQKLLKAVLEDRRDVVIDEPELRRVYVLLVGARQEYAARLDLAPELTAAQFLTGNLWTSIGILLLGLVALILLTYILLNRLVMAPLSSMVQASRRVSEGDYTRPIPSGARQDEMATMIEAFNSMMEKLSAYHETLQADIKRARERITNTERKLFHAQRLSTTGTLAAGIAHEINNPLGGMINAAEVLRSGKLDADKQRQYLELIADGLARVRGIVQKILHFRPQALQPVAVHLPDTVARAISFLEHKASRRGVEIQNEVTGDIEPVFGDPLELQQAVLNLIMNAVDAVEERKGRIRITHRREGGRAYITIQDNGIGMTPEELDRCMDPFFTTKDVGEGSGLGLPVAVGIVQNHGGKLNIQSEKGRGTTVTIELPAGASGPGPSIPK